jgi:hypothetical protein
VTDVPRMAASTVVSLCRAMHEDLVADSARRQDEGFDTRAELLQLTDQLAELTLILGALAREVAER